MDGLRLDAADRLDPEFRQDLAAHCAAVKPGFWLMGEVVHGDYRQWAHAGGLSSTTNYEAYKSLWSAHNDRNYFELGYSLNRQFGEGGLYRDLLLYSFADNHDVDRVASTLSNGLETVAQAARQGGTSVRTYNVDLADESAISQLPNAIASDLGAASVLINNAGIALAGSFEQVSAQRFHHLFAVNFFSMVAMTRGFLLQLRQHQPAQIVNMSSVFGLIGSAGQVAYTSQVCLRGFHALFACSRDNNGCALGIGASLSQLRCRWYRR